MLGSSLPILEALRQTLSPIERSFDFCRQVTMADHCLDFAELEAAKMSEHSDSSSSVSIPPRLSGADAGRDLEKSSSHAVQHPAGSGHPVHKVVTAQDWTSPDDPENPMNWEIWRKVYHVAIPALQCFTMYDQKHLLCKHS